MSISQPNTVQFQQEQYTIKLGARNFVITTKMILIAILFLSITLRLFSAVYQGNNVTDLPGIYDQISYDGLARRVADGFGFTFAEGHWPATPAGQPTAHWSYLYTLYLIVVYKLFGTNPLAARVLQALIAGIFQTLLMWRIGTRLFNRTVGLVAATLNAVYIYFFYYAGALITETFYITGILWIFDSALRLVSVQANPSQKRTIHWWQWLELGLAMGVTVLLRQVFLIFLPILYLWLWWNVRGGEVNLWMQRLHWSALKGLSLATLILVLMILPWTIKNQRSFGTFELLNTNAGFAFFWGNNPIYGTNFIPLLPSSQSYYDLIPPELRSLNEAELDKALLQRGLQFITDDPKRFFLLSISRAREFFKFWPSSDSGLLSNISRVGSFGISLPFMLYGLWCALISDWKSRTVYERWGIALLVLFMLSYTAVHLFSWALIRYRLPVDAVLLIFAAFGINKLIDKYFPSLGLK
jgi:hypothetical protein